MKIFTYNLFKLFTVEGLGVIPASLALAISSSKAFVLTAMIGRVSVLYRLN